MLECISLPRYIAQWRFAAELSAGALTLQAGNDGPEVTVALVGTPRPLNQQFQAASIGHEVPVPMPQISKNRAQPQGNMARTHVSSARTALNVISSDSEDILGFDIFERFGGLEIRDGPREPLDERRVVRFP